MTVAYPEGAVTRVRREFKLVLEESEAEVVCRRLRFELGAPPAETAITSVYFDRAGSPLAQRAQRTPQDCLKIRTKEYFPDQLAGTQPRVVLEAKREKNGLTRKRRRWLTRGELGSHFGRGHGGLLPTLAVTYVRQVYQHSATWRVTVDRDIRYYRVDQGLALGLQPVTAQLLGSPTGCERRVVLEVKHFGQGLPEWLEMLQERRSRRFSKFAEGVAQLASTPMFGIRGG